MKRPRHWKAHNWFAALVVIVAAVLVAWQYQSEIIGAGASFYLKRIAAREASSGDLTQRRQTIARLHRQLLIAPPADALVPELFDFVAALSGRVASGEISLAWGAYLYTSHYRDAVARPESAPRPTAEQLAAEIQEGVEFFYLRKRPDVAGAQVKELWSDGESFTVEEIEKAEREGRDLTREP
jgi:hypothetical protein